MDSKKWYTSKTLWANTLALIGLWIQSITGKEIINLQVQEAALAAINIIIRFVTKTQVVW